MKRATMNDVATRAGVSKTTVSHVINNTRYVEEKTKERVLQAIRDLDYRPNAAARSLTTQRTGIIGMVISDATNLFYSEMLLGVEEVTRAENYGLVVCNTSETLELEDHYLNLLLGQRVEGIIAAATSQKWNSLVTAEVQHTPVVFVDRTFKHLAGPFVGADNHGGTIMGMQHLIRSGHTQIGLVAGFQRLSTMRARVVGFRQAMDDAKIPYNEQQIETSQLSINGGKAATLKLLRQLPHLTALFVNNNLLCLGALLALRELKLECPKDISIVSFDEHPWAAVSEPPLTVVRQPAREVGRQAARRLCNTLNGQKYENNRLILPCDLVIRKSVQLLK